MKKLPLLALLLAALLAAPSARPARADAVTDWFKNAAASLKGGPASPGKVPAIFCTVSMVSIKPADNPGAKPDRSQVMYAYGEVIPNLFPGPIVLEGNLPLWINSGDGKNPFDGGQSSTLNVVLRDSGVQSFNWQISGRNRLGQGPQSFSLNAQTAQLTPDFLLYTGGLNFHGFKNVTLTLVRGEKDGTAAPPPPAAKPLGVRLRITPSFFLNNVMKAAGNDSAQVHTEINFQQKGKQIGFLSRTFPKKSGASVTGDAFEFVVMNADPASNQLRIEGSVPDPNPLPDKGPIWSRVTTVNPASEKQFSIGPDASSKGSYGTLRLKVEKIADVF